MIEQIKDILKHIENSNSQSEKIKSSLEVSELVFKENNLQDIDFKALETEDIILDSILSIDEIVKYSSNFLSSALNYLEEDLKGSNFETDIEDDLKLLQELNIKFMASTKKHKELSQVKEKVKKVKSEIDNLQIQIDEYEQIDLEKIKLEKDKITQRLAEIQRVEGDNLISYQRHLRENEEINIFSSELLDLTNKIKKGLDNMDEILIQSTKKKELN